MQCKNCKCLHGWVVIKVFGAGALIMLIVVRHQIQYTFKFSNISHKLKMSTKQRTDRCMSKSAEHLSDVCT